MNRTREPLRNIFATPGWARFIGILREHRDAGRPFPAAITLSDPTDEERRRQAALLRLKTPSKANRLRYDLAAISQALAHAGLPPKWEELLDIVCGPVPPEALAARASTQAWRDFWPEASETIVHFPFPGSAEWLESLRRDGTLKRLSSGDASLAARWLELSAKLLQSLPLPEEQPLAQTAARFCGSSHALDPATPLSTLVLRGLSLRQGTVLSPRAAARRELWAANGVICDDLSAPVLTFNLGITGSAPLASFLGAAKSAVQPIHLSSRLLWATSWDILAFPTNIFICENPSIISLAASHLGEKCPPLICTDGEPKTAFRLLMRALTKGGSTLHYHGDFDWPGLAIATRIFREFGASPWNFDAEAYLSAGRFLGRPLLGKPVPTPWSPLLCEVMKKAGLAYDQELLIDDLLIDLQNPQ